MPPHPPNDPALTTPPHSRVPNQTTVWQELRAGWRLFRLTLLLTQGLLVVGTVFPWIKSIRRQRYKQIWSRKLLSALGIRYEASTPNIAAPALLVSNHISWLDVFVLNALTPTHFVCKEEVRHWPIIGWLVSRTETVFIERGSRAAASRTGLLIKERLINGHSVAVFPEGTTTDGTMLLPFHAALFQAAVEARKPTIPIALSYLDAEGMATSSPAYDGEVSFWLSLRAIMLSGHIVARLKVLQPVAAGLDRRQLVAVTADAISRQLQPVFARLESRK